MENLPEEELHDESAKKIRDMYKEAALPQHAEQKIIDRLKSAGLINTFSRSFYLRLAAVIILVPALFAAGYFIGNNNINSNIQDVGGNYLLLLYQPANFLSSKEHVKEYGTWLKNLQKDGRLASGEKLMKKAWLMSADKTENVMPQTERGFIGGLFIIKAASESEALSVANTCPHLKYNGLIEVRPIANN